MSNNAPDYEDDLVFPSRHDKTAYELKLENNKLRGLLKECEAHLSLGEIGTSVTPVNILLTRINAVLDDNKIQANPVDDIKIQESEEK